MIKLVVRDYLMSVKALNKGIEIGYTIDKVNSISEIRFETYFSDLKGKVLISDGIVTSIRNEIIRKDNTVCTIEKINFKKGGARWIGIISREKCDGKEIVKVVILTTEDDLTPESFNEELIASFCRI